MGKRIKLTKTDVFLLGLTVLFVLAMALTWLLTPRQVRGGYDISAVPPEEAAPALLKVNINTASAEELDGLPGIGQLFVNGALNRDYSLVLSLTILVGALTILFNAIVDVLYAVIDPKIRY